jgi:hypothetical protein
MPTTPFRRPAVVLLFLFGAVLTAAGVYLLYCRFGGAPAGWDQEAAAGRRMAEVEADVSELRKQADDLRKMVQETRRVADQLRRAGREDDARKADAVAERTEGLLVERMPRLEELEKNVAATRAEVDENRGDWLRRGILFTAVGLLALFAAGRSFRAATSPPGPPGGAGSPRGTGS